MGPVVSVWIPKLPVKVTLPVALLLARSFIRVPATVTVSPTTIVGIAVPVVSATVSCVPASFQAAVPKATAPSNQVWELLSTKVPLILAAEITGLLVASLKVSTTVSPAFNPKALPVSAATAEVNAGPVVSLAKAPVIVCMPVAILPTAS